MHRGGLWRWRDWRGDRLDHLVKMLRLAESLELEVANVVEGGALHLAGDGTQGLGDQDLARLRNRADSRGEIHRPAEEVGSFSHRLACVDPDPDLDPRARPLAVGLADR